MSEELVVQSAEQALAVGGLGFQGRMFSLRPAVIDLVQRTTRDAEPNEVGRFRVRGTKELFDELHIVMLRAPQESRVLFPPGQDLGQEPLCRSNDGLVPADNAAVPQAPKCGYWGPNGFVATCDQASWKKWAKTKKKEDIPACKQKIRILFVERSTGVPFMLTLGGKAIRPVIDAMQHVARMAEVLKAKGENPSIFDFSMKLRPVKVDGKKGTYYVVSFTDIARVKVEDRAKFGELYVQFANRTAEVEVAEAEEAVNGSLSEDSVIEG